MFKMTYLGHQGWLFESRGSRLLVDPLLNEEFGHPSENLRVFPPRQLELTALPPVDAVFVTHEHPDHFDLGSLNLLSRKIPLYLSGRASVAAETIAREMGFEVHLAQPGEVISVGADLQLLPFSPDHVNNDELDEWDTLPYVVKCRHGDGSFFSFVDVQTTEEMMRRAREFSPELGVYCYTDNQFNLAALAPWIPSDGHGPWAVLSAITRGMHRLSDCWSPPAVWTVAGTGMSFGGELAFLNRSAFTYEVTDVFSGLAGAHLGAPFVGTLPGCTLSFEGGRYLGKEEGAPGVRTAPRGEWPSRTFDPDFPRRRTLQPGCGQARLLPEQEPQLEAALGDLARFLYARHTFRKLHSTLPEHLEGRRGTFALSLLVDEARTRRVYAYAPRACRFEREEGVASPEETFAGGLEIFATDLIALHRGELSPAGLFFRAQEWCHLEDLVPANFGISVILPWGHPLLRPAENLAQYRREHAALPRLSPPVRAPGEQR